MRELVNCPFCKKPLKTKLIADFEHLRRPEDFLTRVKKV